MESSVDDSPISVSPDSTLDNTSLTPHSLRPINIDKPRYRRSLLDDLNAASDEAHKSEAVEPDDFDKFHDDEEDSPSSGEAGDLISPNYDSAIGSGCRFNPLADEDPSELTLVNRECARMRAEVRKLRNLNVQKANLLTHKEALLQESEGRAKKVQNRYEKLLQEQLANTTAHSQDWLPALGRYTSDQLVEIARLQAEVSRIHRLEAEVEERATMEAELTALLHEKVQDCVQLQQANVGLTEQVSQMQVALQTVTQHRDRLASDMEKIRFWLENHGLLDEVRAHLQTNSSSPAIHDSASHGWECSRLQEEKTSLQVEISELRTRLEDVLHSQVPTHSPILGSRSPTESPWAIIADLRLERDRALQEKSIALSEVSELRQHLEEAMTLSPPSNAKELEKECMELRQRMEEQHQVERQLKQRFEREVAQLTQKLAAEKRAFEAQKEEQIGRLLHENAQLRLLAKEEAGVADAENWANMQKMIDSLQRMVTQQHIHETASPPSLQRNSPSPLASLQDNIVLSSPPLELADQSLLTSRLSDDWEPSSAPTTGRTSDPSTSASVGTGRSSPSRKLDLPRGEPKKMPIGYPRPTSGLGPTSATVVRPRLPSFPPRKETSGFSRRGVVARESTPPGPRVPPSLQSGRDTSSPNRGPREPSPTGLTIRHSSPNRFVINILPGSRSARPPGGAQSRSISAPQRALGAVNGAVARNTVQAPEGQNVDAEAVTNSGPIRIGDRSLATVLKRGPNAAQAASSGMRHPTPPQLDRKRATSAPQIATPLAKAASPRGTVNVRAPKQPNLPRHLQ